MKKNRLTRKQKLFADKLINEPKKSATQVASEVYNTTTRGSAAITAHENLMKPNIQLYLDRHIDKAKNRVVQLVDSEKEEIALRASDSILDRALGKATQRLETHSTTVNLNLDLTNITEVSTPTPPSA